MSNTISMKRITFLSICFCLVVSTLTAQSYWVQENVDTKRTPILTNQKFPKKHITFKLDRTSFINIAETAPRRFRSSEDSGIVIDIPTPNGELQKFKIQKSSVLHPDLAAKYPGIYSFVGKGVNNPSLVAHLTYSTTSGFNGMILSSEGTYYIDPYDKSRNYYIVHKRADRDRVEHKFSCLTDHDHAEHDHDDPKGHFRATGDCNLRKYELAQSCTGEYAQFHINDQGVPGSASDATKKAAVLAAMNTTMARVNGVYERDFGITLEIIPNNDLIIYLDASTDPWGGEYNTTTQNTIDDVIGDNNYDIGHNFNTSGGGNAGCIGCVCVTGSKGSAYTGQSSPKGDLFDIDYVAHEMGHQFGGYHTMGSTSCRSGSGNTEVEPGSASTIMGYAGICNTNVQNQSDDYFHYVNIRDVVNYIVNGNGNNCAELITSGNTGPVATSPGNFTIPKSTPFKLEGTGTDIDGDALTYCWEQNDPENPGHTAPTTTQTQGPLFRSFRPVAEPYRYFPALPDIIANNTPTMEVLPGVGRTMDFAFTVRDNNSASGCTDSDLITITVASGAGPFLVTSPNSAVTYGAGTNQTITWDVAGTTGNGVNCANVDIYFSDDGGNTYPTLLASSVANDGSHEVLMPSSATTTARIMVKCSDNVFFDISNEDFTLELVNPDFTIFGNPSTVATCSGSPATFNIEIGSLLGFTDPVNVSASGPAGLAFTFSSSTVVPGNSTALTVSNTGALSNSSYTLTVTGVSGSLTHDATLTLNIDAPVTESTVLTSPADQTSGVNTTTTFTWNAVTNASSHDFELASDAAFTSIVSTQSGLTVPEANVAGMTSNTLYYWRARAVSGCGPGTWSDTYIFDTQCDDVTLTIVLDNYPEETSWELFDGAGTSLATGGTYGSQPDGSTVTETFCLGDGCYDLVLADTYGDGICCGYGNGSYTVTDADGNVLASGGQFASSVTENFCITLPNCFDGVQNGDETDVDCGGTLCPACVTCDTPPTGISTFVNSTERVTISWDNNPIADSYQVKYKRSGTTTWITKGATPGNDFKELWPLVEGATYQYRVRMFCTTGVWSPYSDVATFTMATCDAPSGFNYTTTPNGRHRFDWSAATNRIKYQIQHRVPGGTWSSSIGSTPGNDFKILPAETFTPGTTYQIKVRTLCTITPLVGQNVWSEFSAPYSFTAGAATARLSNHVDDQGLIDFTFMPNPAKDALSISFETESEEDVSILVYDIVGNRVISKNIGSNGGAFSSRLDVSNLERGYYFLVIQQGNQSETRKFGKL